MSIKENGIEYKQNERADIRDNFDNRSAKALINSVAQDSENVGDITSDGSVLQQIVNTNIFHFAPYERIIGWICGNFNQNLS